MSYRWGNQYKIWSDYLYLTGCSAAVLATTVESSPAIFSMGMYPGCVGLSFLSPETKRREQTLSPVYSCHADPSVCTL